MKALQSKSKGYVLGRCTVKRGACLAVFLLTTVLTGCGPKFQIADNFLQPPPSVRILLMEPDVLLSELTSMRGSQPKADWTAAGKKNVIQALTAFLKEKEDTLIPYKEPDNDPASLSLHNQLIKLHEAVGETILLHKYNSGYELPTKSKRFDWSLGKGTNPLREQYDADYALFIYLRDSYVSLKRGLDMFFGGLVGVSVQGGTQVGFASLVDLRTGEVVWFNRLLRSYGDLRSPESAREAVQQLLKNIPI